MGSNRNIGRIDATGIVCTIRTCSRDCGGDGSPSRRSVVGSLPVVGVVGGGEGLPAEVGERGERGGAALCTSHQRKTDFFF